MRHRRPFVIFFIAAISLGFLVTSASSQVSNSTVNGFLHCVGLRPMNMSDNNKEHIQNLNGVAEEALDVYSFLRSGLVHSPIPILELAGSISVNASEGEPFQEVNFIKAWFQVKLKPLLPTVSSQFLSCLSTKNFSCETYQSLVKDLSDHFSSLDPARQRWIYMSFMYPFLARNSTAGCAANGDSSKDWLMKNFGTFSGMAHFKDFTTLNPAFNGLEVLNFLTPEQKAELILHPEIGGLDNSTISLIFQSLLQPLLNNQHLNQSGPTVSMTTPPLMHNMTTVQPNMTAPLQNLKESFNKFLMYLKPLGSFVKQFVSLTQQNNLTSIKSTMLTQAVLNWTLAELAGHFPENITLRNTTKPNPAPSLDNFDITSMDNWFRHVVVPVLRRFLPKNQTEIPQDLTAVFQHVFSLNSGVDPTPSGPPHICDAILNGHSCSMSNTAQNLARVLSCAAHINLTMSEENLKLLVTELSGPLSSSMDQYSNLNMSSVESPLSGYTSENLQHVDFIRLWFQIKLRPLLPSISAELLSCLSTRNFSCESYQALIMELSTHISSLDEMRQQFMYTDFIHYFLSQRQSTGSSCILHANDSAEWVTKNFGGFSIFAPLQDFLTLHPNFSAVQALSVLTPRQTAELIVSAQTRPPHDIFNKVFDHILQSPKDRRLGDFLRYVVMLTSMANISCDFYSSMVNRLDQLLSSEPREFETIRAGREALLQMVPQNCIISAGCIVIPVNETGICTGVNSSVLPLADGNMTTMLCDSNLTHYACMPVLTQLTSENVVSLLSCKLHSNMTYPAEVWKLFLTKVSGVLDEALITFSNMSLNLSGPAASPALDAIAEILISRLSNSSLGDIHSINRLFQGQLMPFLPFASQDFLSCLSTRNFSCETYQAIVRILGHQYRAMDRMQQTLVYNNFIRVFMSQSDTSDPGCIYSSNGSANWLQMNFGEFSGFLSFKDILRFNRNFTALDALPLLTLEQLADVSATPGQLRTPADVNKLMNHVKDAHLRAFFDRFSPAIEGRDFPVEVLSAMLQQVLDRGNLSDPAIRDTEVLVWLRDRLRPLLPHLSQDHVAPMFNIVRRRGCIATQEVVKLMNEIQPTLKNSTQNEVYANILLSLREPTPLRCFVNGSFYLFLKSSFLNFQFPKLSTFLSLIPPNRRTEIISSLPPAELGDFLRGPMAVDNDKDLCTVFDHFNQIPEFLQNENVPDGVRRSILPCVWHLALRSEDEAEVNEWFEKRLRSYLKFLNKDLISSTQTLNATCLPFRKFVSVLGNDFSYNRSDFTQADVYSTIKNYLKTDKTPKCYNAANPKLNSTAWFANYIGVFIKFISLEDLDTFGSEEALSVFSVNPENIQLFSHASLPQSITSRFTELIYVGNPGFNPLQLPISFLCDVPGAAFSQLGENDSISVLDSLNQTCTAVDPAVSAALAGNIKTINAASITALGREITGLSPGQITAAPPRVIVDSLHKLSTVTGWNQGQAITIIRVLQSGSFKIDSPQKLLQLGTLIRGVPSKIISSINPSDLLETATDATFITNIVNAPQIVRQTFVRQIVSVSLTSQQLLQNIPDAMATEIPRNKLSFLTADQSEVAQRINQKTWKREQAVLFFDTVANGISDADDISTDVLQGFTCTRVQTFTKVKIKNLVRACRRRKNRRKVVLSQTQLTCMYNNIKDESPQNFVDFPSDMLLYYNYAKVQLENCRSYFTEAGNANFNVLSSVLSSRKTILLNNAKSCLGIAGTNITRENVEVLGNMCCTLDQSYIEGSDPLILEKLKNCEDFSSAQVTAIESVLLGGNSQYGSPATWSTKTLNDLGILPLYLTDNFWWRITTRDKRKFLKEFMKNLRKLKTEKRKLKKLFKAVTGSRRMKRAAGNECTVGSITQVTINDDAFPFGYDAAQFNCCLDVNVVKENLASLTEKVDDDEFQQIILTKLNQAYPSGLSDEQVQVLGSVSRVASLDDISKWNVTTIDTLAALMDSSGGDWLPEKSKDIITKYLTTNTLGTSELNVIGGTNLCSLDASVLQTITSISIRDANSLDISVCSIEKKRQLFSIAKAAFTPTPRNSNTLLSYQLIQPYLEGADVSYIRSLSTANISMDLNTFTSLDETVILNLTVSEVKGLLGLNLPDLKTFENATVIQKWISRQLQSELDSLNLNLAGGKADPATTAATTTTTTATATTSATTTKTTVSGKMS
ncbi:uncharacterized protein mslna [Megalops cyprinoides]|uniref:uncharacterized protein mslna n=1 Tax=Megalops cyprinoides TaxID=118141 RepID=UPI0018645B1B|nr:uncharacterized protein mslna [Megalops cyprinoides]